MPRSRNISNTASRTVAIASPGFGQRRAIYFAAATAAWLIAALLAATGAGAAAPAVSNGGTTNLTANSVTLNGKVSPNGEATTYHFEIGPTTAYGTSTSNGSLAATAKKNTPVSAPVGALSPSTTYHYRLVATNASGTRMSGDRAFTTPAGLSLGGRTRTVFGRLLVLSGVLTPAAAGVEVRLQENPYPFAGFKNTLMTTTDSTGRYAFNVNPAVNTNYRTMASSRPTTTSPTLTMRVAPSVTLRLRRRGGSLRASGAVTPAHNGGSIQIQRRTRRGWRRVTTFVLAATKDPGRSSYSGRVRLRKGLYRAFFAADADHAQSASTRRRVR